jgi:hypothetical protein
MDQGLTKLTSDRVFKAKDGAASGIMMLAYNSPVAYSDVNTVLKKGVEINKFHKKSGHFGSDRSEKSAKIHGFKLIGEFETYKECAISKARQKNVKKDWNGGSQTPGERLYVDISSIKNAGYGGSKFGILIVDDYTAYC